MLRGKDHTWKGGIHSEGWSRDWKVWIQRHDDEGTKITKEMIDGRLKKMIAKYKLNERGFASKFCYEQVERAYRVADQMARRRALQEAAELAAKASRKAGRRAASELAGDAAKTGSKGRIASKLAKIPVVGFFVGVVAGAALGDEDALINAIEPIGFEATPAGYGSEVTQDDRDRWAYRDWQREQYELDLRWAERQRRAGGLNTLAQEGLRFESCPVPSPVSHPSRSSSYGTR